MTVGNCTHFYSACLTYKCLEKGKRKRVKGRKREREKERER